MLTIVKGDDRTIDIFFVSSGEAKRPFDLTGWTNISVFFREQFGGLLEKNTQPYNTAAYALYEGVTFTANVLGTAGNSIVLAFDGVSTIQQIVNLWNDANSGNQVSGDYSDGSLVLPEASVALQFGQTGLTDVVSVSDVLGHIQVTLHDFDTVNMLAGRNLSFKAVIDKGTPPIGERRKVIFDNVLEVIDDTVL